MTGLTRPITLMMAALALLAVQAALAQDAPAPAQTRTLQVNDEIFAYLADEPSNYLVAAREQFGQDRQAAALNIRKAMSLIELEAARAEGPTRQELRDVAAQLRAVARVVDSGKLQSPQPMERVFARAEYALARHHRNQAQQLVEQDQSRAASWELAAARRNVTQGLRWAGRKVVETGETAATGLASVPGLIVEGAGWTTEQIGDGLGFVGNQLDQLGDALQPGQDE